MIYEWLKRWVRHRRRLAGGCRLAWLGAGLLSSAVWAEVLPLPPEGTDLVGEVRHVRARYEDTLVDIARAYSLGQDEIVMANPMVDRWLPGAGTKVLVPHQFILPNAPRTGIVVNIPEMRLYYYPSAGKGQKPTKLVTYPISIGRMDWRTPLGVTRVVAKVKDPFWRPPPSIKAEHAKEGDFLPDVVPPGPNNPLGQFAMRLGVPGYLIHGTGLDKAYGIGMRVTHGCIRMYPEDIAKLFPEVPVGTPVNLVNQPVKLGWKDGRLYLEVSQPLDEDRMSYEELLAKATTLIEKHTAGRPVVIDQAAVVRAVRQPTGIPTVIGAPPGMMVETDEAPLAAPTVAPSAAVDADALPDAWRPAVPASSPTGDVMPSGGMETRPPLEPAERPTLEAVF